MLNAFLKGEKTAGEVNATADIVLTRVDGLIDDYIKRSKGGYSVLFRSPVLQIHTLTL